MASHRISPASSTDVVNQVIADLFPNSIVAQSAMSSFYNFNASSETGAWAHCNPTCPEVTAEELRQAYKRFLENQKD